MSRKLNTHILHRWDQEEAEREALRTKTKEHIEELADRKNRLIDAFLGKQINSDAYKTHLKHVNKELEDAKVAHAALSHRLLFDMRGPASHRTAREQQPGRSDGGLGTGPTHGPGLADLEHGECLAKRGPASHRASAILEFSEDLLPNLLNRYKSFDLNQMRLFQQVIFPSGFEFGPQKVGTALTDPVFSVLAANGRGDKKMATPTGFEPEASV